MPLKKPKEFYTLKPNTSLDEVRESATPEKVETISGAFNAFKTNLNHVQSISDFTNKFDTFEANIEKVDALAETIEDIRGDIQELIKSVSDATDKLMDLQKKLKDVNAEEKQGPTSVTNNALFVGSTAYLAKLIKGEKTKTE